MNILDIVSIIISVVALGFSAFTLWTMYLKPLRLVIQLGSPIIAKMKTNEGSNLCGLAMILPVDMINTGAIGGSVKDMLVRLDTQDTRYPSWFLHPFYFTKEYSERALEEKYREIVHPIYFQSRERIFRNIIFSPVLEQKYPLLNTSEPILLAGKYKLTLFILSSSDKKFRIAEQISFQVVKDVYGIFVPRASETVEARDHLFASRVNTI